MPLRPTVSDELRRYLEFQRDLGGDELILPEPMDLRARLSVRTAAAKSAQAPRAVAAPQATPSAPVVATLPSQRTIYPTGLPEFLQGAPEIPGPGLTIAMPVHRGDPRQTLATLPDVAAAVAECTRCELCRTRTNTVPGEGNPTARLMVVGEGPGETEDLSGRPFVGRAGELLDRMLAAVHTPRESVYIANVVKCRPPRNRAPLPDEREACLPFLHRQIALVKPAVLLALGSTAAEALLGERKPLGALRLKVHRWGGIPLVITYHPAALLRNPNWKRPAWDDVRIARQLLDAHA